MYIACMNPFDTTAAMNRVQGKRYQMRSPFYSRDVFDPQNLASLVANLRPGIRFLMNELDIGGLIGSGTSAAPLLGALSYTMGIPYLLVRREDEKSHDHGPLVGSWPNNGNLLFVDDLIDSGNTLMRCARAVKKIYQNPDQYNTFNSAGIMFGILYSQAPGPMFFQIGEREFVPVCGLSGLSELVNTSTLTMDFTSRDGRIVPASRIQFTVKDLLTAESKAEAISRGEKAEKEAHECGNYSWRLISRDIGP